MPDEPRDGWRAFVDQASDTMRRSGVNVGALTGQLSSQALAEAARLAAEQPPVIVNRARAAALVDYGYDRLDLYERWRGAIFALTASLSAISLAMAYRRWPNPEATTLYTTSALGNGIVAWITRPDALRPEPAPTPPTSDAPESMAQFLGWLDRRVGRLNSEEPGWERQTWHRLARDLGYGRMNPPTQALLLHNAQ